MMWKAVRDIEINSPGIATAIPVIVITALLVSRFARAQANKFPPSPPADPFIGHVRIMPLDYAWETFAEWAKSYGDVIYTHVFGRSMVIIDSAAAARDLLEKKGAIYSDRPYLFVVGELLGWAITLPTLPYGDRFRKQRRLMQQYFNSQAVHSFGPLQAALSQKFLRDLLLLPEEFRAHIHRLFASTILMVTYGHEVVSDNDPYVTIIEAADRLTIEAGNPGSTLFDLLPILHRLPSWLPGMGLKRHCQIARSRVDEAITLPYNGVKAQLAAGTAKPSFVAQILNDYENTQILDPEHEEDMRGIGASIYAAGTETSTTTIATFFLLMTRHQEVAKRAQEEIDRVTGQSRLPTFEDRARLPYLDCILKEVFRIAPALPLGLPHQVMKTDKYRDWTIPKGALIFPNIWNMMRDKSYYPEPEKFNPDRFIGKSSEEISKMANDEHEGVRLGQVTADDPSTLVFGFGRRLCPGRFLADASIWIAMAYVLAVFDISPIVDPASGKVVLPKMEFASGLATPPKPFKCLITPRSEKHAQLIEQDV